MLKYLSSSDIKHFIPIPLHDDIKNLKDLNNRKCFVRILSFLDGEVFANNQNNDILLWSEISDFDYVDDDGTVYYIPDVVNPADGLLYQYFNWDVETQVCDQNCWWNQHIMVGGGKLSKYVMILIVMK